MTFKIAAARLTIAAGLALTAAGCSSDPSHYDAPQASVSANNAPVVNGPVIDALNTLGVSSYNPEAEARFKAVCSSVQPMAVIWQEANGNAFLVTPNNDGTYFQVQGAVGFGRMTTFYGSYNKRNPNFLDGSSVGGVRINGSQTRGGTTQVPTANVLAQYTRAVADITDNAIFVNRQFPGQPCTYLDRGGAYGYFDSMHPH